MFNPLQIGFLTLNAVYSTLGYLIHYHEKYIPVVIQRAVKSGVIGYQGNQANFVKKLDISKSYYSHYYTFAGILEFTNLVYMTLVYFYSVEVNTCYRVFLEACLGYTSPVSVLASVAALSLVTLQSMKRYYETYYVQVFAKTSKMYPTHYMAGLLFYFAVNVAIVGQAPMFCGDTNRENIVWADLRTIITLVLATPVFLWAWHEQHQTNIILANLRKDKKSGEVVTEEYKIPHGRLFEYVSNPHRFCEIVLYAVLFTIIPTKTFFCIFFWVLCNQTQASLLVHEWYKETFKTYPTKRYALFMGIL